MILKVLSLGEIIGKPGLYAIRHGLNKIQNENKIDYTFANAEGTTYGFGLGKNHAFALLKQGIDCLTGGNKIFFKKDLVENMNNIFNVIRPYNLYPTTPGKSIYTKSLGDKKITLINFQGMTFSKFTPQNPFLSADYILDKLQEQNTIVIAQFFATATAEALAFAHHIKDKVSAVIGTSDKVLTSDAKLLDNKTGYITDNGRVGSLDSIAGFKIDNEIESYLTGIPTKSEDVFSDIRIQGVILSIDTNTKECVEIQTINEKCEVKND